MSSETGEVAARQRLEREIITFLVEEAARHGYSPVYTFDGEEREPTPTLQEVLDTVFSVDESVIWFRNPDTKQRHCAVIVLGNDGYDAIADCSEGPGWDDVIKAVSDKFDPQ